jgi:hypothetical protein
MNEMTEQEWNSANCDWDATKMLAMDCAFVVDDRCAGFFPSKRCLETILMRGHWSIEMTIALLLGSARNEDEIRAVTDAEAFSGLPIRVNHTTYITLRQWHSISSQSRYFLFAPEINGIVRIKTQSNLCDRSSYDQDCGSAYPERGTRYPGDCFNAKVSEHRQKNIRLARSKSQLGKCEESHLQTDKVRRFSGDPMIAANLRLSKRLGTD